MDEYTPLLLQRLRNKALYDHAVQRFELVETHISWVLLTGPYAYKIKKPVDLGFLDFSSLEKRHFFSVEEVRLNRRLAAALYLGVVAITGTPERPRLNGPGAAIEYAVKMVQFAQEDQFDRMLTAGRLRAEHMDAVARKVARFHAVAAVAGADTPFGNPDEVHRPVMENFTHICPVLAAEEDKRRLDTLAGWCQRTHESIRDRLRQRKEGGHIRECHGDMHLANIALFKGEATVFDCIEFSERLRWIDTMSETAFLKMDLDAHGQDDLGWRYLNTYLQHTGDYAGLATLPYYLVYRALVRAKVACIRLRESGLAPELRRRIVNDYRAHVALAQRYGSTRRAALIITHGLSGSGKTMLTLPLLERWGAVRIRSDVERKRLYGLPAEARSASAIDGGIYTAAAGEKTYARLAALAESIATAGYPVIVDATFLKRAQRERFRHLAARLAIPYVILDFHAPQALLRRWISERHAAAQDASEADLAVLDHQLATREALARGEQAAAISVDTAVPVDMDVLAGELSRRLAD